MDIHNISIGAARAFLYIPDTAAGKWIAYFQGFPSSIPKSSDYPFFQWAFAQGYSVATMSYPGVQDSPGEFSPKQCLVAGEQLISTLMSKTSKDLRHQNVDWACTSIVLVGTSFGATLALCLSQFPHITHTIAISPVTDWKLPIAETDEQMRSDCATFYPFTVRLGNDWNDWSALNPVDCINAKQKLSCSLVHAKDDPLVPFNHSHTFSVQFNIPLYTLQEGGHLGARDLPSSLLDEIFTSFTLK